MMLRRRTSGSQERRQQMQSHIPASRTEVALNAHADDLHIKHETRGSFKMKEAGWGAWGRVRQEQGPIGKACSMRVSANDVAGKQCLHNSPASSCACKYGKFANGKNSHEPNKACGISRWQPEGCNDSKETNHSTPPCATHHPLSMKILESYLARFMIFGADPKWVGGGKLGMGGYLRVYPRKHLNE